MIMIDDIPEDILVNTMKECKQMTGSVLVIKELLKYAKTTRQYFANISLKNTFLITKIRQTIYIVGNAEYGNFDSIFKEYMKMYYNKEIRCNRGITSFVIFPKMTHFTESIINSLHFQFNLK